MQDRQPGKPGQYKATLTPAEFQKMQAGQQFTITMIRDDQPIVEGTPYSKASVLPYALAKIVCPKISNPTPAHAFRGLLQKTSPHNLLDNSDFRNPVNQRGKDVYAYAGIYMYTIDRWAIYSEGAVVTVEDGYISKTKTLSQIIAGLDKNKTYTAAVCSKEGTVSVYSGTITNGIGSYYDNVYCYSGEGDRTVFELPTRGFTEVQWAALYEGEYTAENLPEYKPKGYAAELAECQRYYRYFGHPSSTAMLFVGVAYNATAMYCSLPFEMRIIPTVEFENIKITASGLSSAPDAVGMQAGTNVKGSTLLTIIPSENLIAGNPYCLWTGGSGEGYIALSADL